MARFKVEVWTDGACKGNGTDKSVGGRGVVIASYDTNIELKAAEYNTTNNAQEIKAVIMGLNAVVNPGFATVTVFSDSAYVVNCINQKWYKKWRVNGWMTSKRTPVENKELWIELLNAIGNFSEINFTHVPGHRNVGYNERCDELANLAIQELIDSGSVSH